MTSDHTHATELRRNDSTPTPCEVVAVALSVYYRQRRAQLAGINQQSAHVQNVKLLLYMQFTRALRQNNVV